MKGPMPPIELDEEFTLEDLKIMSREELDKIPYTPVRWQCKIKLCKSFTRLRDYGVHPWYYHPRGVCHCDGTTIHWIHVYNIFRICHKHKKYWKLQLEETPVKRNANGSIVQGFNYTGKEAIIY